MTQYAEKFNSEHQFEWYIDQASPSKQCSLHFIQQGIQVTFQTLLKFIYELSIFNTDMYKSLSLYKFINLN